MDERLPSLFEEVDDICENYWGLICEEDDLEDLEQVEKYNIVFKYKFGLVGFKPVSFSFS